MFDRYEAGETAVLVHIDFSDEERREDLVELQLLVESAGARSVGVITGSRRSPDRKFFIGSGKAEELAALVAATEANVVIFNHALSPAQERNLEQVCQCRVLDRTSLILDIFAQRARTHEGKLQVELAQLRHMSTRLVRGWTHLERQKGGIGLRGPGETQLETDRRLLRGRIKNINKRLERVDKQREQSRRARKRSDMPTVSLVGYTNAGKSTLFNALTSSDVYAADQLFATLDPTLRKLDLPDGAVILADTVGFIRHLPHDLVAAFKATLQETRQADLLLHIVDCADENMADNFEQVQSVLKDIDADKVMQLIVCNKIDLLEDVTPRIEYDDRGKPVRVWVSAHKRLGFNLLLKAITELIGEVIHEFTLRIPATAGHYLGQFYRLDAIQQKEYDDLGNCILSVRLSDADWRRLAKQSQGELETFIFDPSIEKAVC
ncbi:ribosome rescue GTPase HflX [Shewanella xiamenensis]|uniref:ribosome rescue GTPase HflX n=1 Tax=Shewanella xiamenensis TaxID=332186 RepID=UPI0024A72215|nr:ribosome rescue GTPase HflX [Shewanella xiamenensis]MDI5844983.1 GTPase HflX [Shewanella xiamenensis]MDI5853014.1 GTPase HflX [Shewanella xiamenensis]MDI5857160.1 GTPase HflX [Shewanella xiamenensis]MDI5864947.1 GTPase HflX [Shewanella xiamenensis]MDI5873000.1 GTPase HflX [Shewanella xiamenensis]